MLDIYILIKMKTIYFLIILILILVVVYLLYKKLYELDGRIYVDNFIKPNYNFKNKKIAICLSGQIRDGYEQTLLLQKIFLIDSLGADVFCCFEETDNDIKYFIKKNINPKKIIYVNDIPVNSNCKVSHGTMCMYNKIYLANKLKSDYEIENNFVYDYVIRIRPDLLIKEHLSKNIFESDMKNNIYMPIISKVFINYGYPDFMAISTSSNMDKYSNIYNYFLNNFENECNISESLLFIYLEKQKIKGVLFNYPIQLIRFTYDNIDNIINSIKYINSLFDRYVINNKCKVNNTQFVFRD